MVEQLTIEATIPTVQYGNIRSTIILDEENYSSWEEMRNDALKKTKEISDMTAGDGCTFELRGITNTGSKPISFKEIKSELTGVSVAYDELNHKYLSKDGKVYTSGSKFPEKYYPDFDKVSIIEKMVTKHPDVSGMDINNMWGLNASASSSLGKSVHSALENYDKYSSIGAVLADTDKPNKALSKNPMIKAIVEKFHEGRENEDVLSECFVANDEYCLAGVIDRLKFVDREKKIVRVQDFKTDGDIHEKRYQVKDSPFKGVIDNTLAGLHFLQLSFYAFILEQAGYTVEGLDLFWFNAQKFISGENPWETITSKVIDIKKELSK